jgi:ABC-type glycerol-3-phosphate transport system permease component
VREGAQAHILAVTGAIALGGFCLAPFAYMLWIAFARGAEPGSAASGFTLDHFREALDPSLHMAGYLRNTLVTASAAAVLAPAAAVLAAYPLARLPLPGRRGVLLAALALSMFPPVSLAGALFRLLAGLGWINTPMPPGCSRCACGSYRATWPACRAISIAPPASTVAGRSASSRGCCCP